MTRFACVSLLRDLLLTAFMMVFTATADCPSKVWTPHIASTMLYEGSTNSLPPVTLPPMEQPLDVFELTSVFNWMQYSYQQSSTVLSLYYDSKPSE